MIYKKIDNKVLLIIYLLISSLVVIRNYSLFPSVMGDEFIHSLFSRKTEIKEITIPSYLYYFFFKITNLCGDEYLNCNRLINYFFFSLGAYLIYLVGKKYSQKSYSIIIFFLILLSPFNVYTAYFMPEVMYFCFFWIFIYILLSTERSYKNTIFLGVLLGACYLIKPHALFLLPALIIFLFIFNKNFRNFIENVAILLFCFFIFKYLILITIKSDFTFFGNYYNESAYDYITFNKKDLSIIIKYSLINLYGIWSYLFIIFGIPIIICIKNILDYINKDKNINIKLSILTILFVASLTIIYSIFMGFSSFYLGQDIIFENPLRLNNRYYFFIYPLFFIVFLNEFKIKNIKKINSNLIKFFTIIILLSVIYFIVNKYPSYHLVDGPLYRGIIYNEKYFLFIVLFSFSITILLFLNYNLSLKLYLYLFLPLVLVITSIPISKELSTYKKPSTSDIIGEKIHKELVNEKNKSFLLISYNEKNIKPLDEFKILFALDKKIVSLIKVTDENIINKKINNDFFLDIGKNEFKFWDNAKLLNYDFYLFIINRGKMKEIYLFDKNKNIIKNIL